jgi:hypothetical protein
VDADRGRQSRLGEQPFKPTMDVRLFERGAVGMEDLAPALSTRGDGSRARVYGKDDGEGCRKVFPEPSSIVSIWKSRKSAAPLPTTKGAAHGDAVVETALAHVLRTPDAPAWRAAPRRNSCALRAPLRALLKGASDQLPRPTRDECSRSELAGAISLLPWRGA